MTRHFWPRLYHKPSLRYTIFNNLNMWRLSIFFSGNRSGVCNLADESVRLVEFYRRLCQTRVRRNVIMVEAIVGLRLSAGMGNPWSGAHLCFHRPMLVYPYLILECFFISCPRLFVSLRRSFTCKVLWVLTRIWQRWTTVYGYRDRHTHKQVHEHTNMSIVSYACMHAHKRTHNALNDRRRDRHTDNRRDRHTDGQTYKQGGRRTPMNKT